MIHLPVAPGSQPQQINVIPREETLDGVKMTRSVKALFGPEERLKWVAQRPSGGKGKKTRDPAAQYAIIFTENMAEKPVNQLAVSFWEKDETKSLYPLRGDILVIKGFFKGKVIDRILPMTVEDFHQVCQGPGPSFEVSTFIDLIPYRRPDDIARYNYHLFLVHNDDHAHQLTQLSELIFDQATGASKIHEVAVDTEGNFDLIQLAFSFTQEGRKKKYVALLHHLRSEPDVKQAIITLLKRLFEDSRVVKIFHAADQDAIVLAKFGISIVKMADTSQAERLAKPEENRSGYSLVDLMALYDFPFNTAIKETIKTQFRRYNYNVWGCDLAKRLDLVDYAVQDVLYLCELKNEIVQGLSPEDQNLLFTKSIPRPKAPGSSPSRPSSSSSSSSRE